jgi:hypothetical protein
LFGPLINNDPIWIQAGLCSVSILYGIVQTFFRKDPTNLR